jgi:hypothetical protein
MPASQLFNKMDCAIHVNRTSYIGTVSGQRLTHTKVTSDLDFIKPGLRKLKKEKSKSIEEQNSLNHVQVLVTSWLYALTHYSIKFMKKKDTILLKYLS